MKEFDHERLLEYFKFSISPEGSRHGATYAKAVGSLTSFLQSQGATLPTDPDEVICDWMVHMCVRGIALNTALPYLNSISGLYKQAVAEGLAPATDVFKRLKAQLKENGESLWDTWLTRDDMSRLVNTARATHGRTDAQRLLVCSLNRGCMPVADAVRLKITDLSAEERELLDIDSSQFTGNRRYIFRLGQTGQTPAQAAATANDAVTALLDDHSVRHTASADATLRSYWAYAALTMGVAPHTVRSYLGTVPAGLPILAICRCEEPDSTTRNELTAHVAKMFTANPPNWYVMRLRPRVKIEDIERRIAARDGVGICPELFYPCEQIMRRIGKKSTTVQKPVIPDIVFFKCRETEVYPLFLHIGDLAWCYRREGREGCAYASVPKKALETFQETIGHFTPDYEVATAGSMPAGVGDEIVVIGGMFRDQEGTVRRIDEDADANKIYRIEIIPDSGQAWTIGIDVRLVRKKQAAVHI